MEFRDMLCEEAFLINIKIKIWLIVVKVLLGLVDED